MILRMTLIRKIMAKMKMLVILICSLIVNKDLTSMEWFISIEGRGGTGQFLRLGSVISSKSELMKVWKSYHKRKPNENIWAFGEKCLCLAVSPGWGISKLNSNERPPPPPCHHKCTYFNSKSLDATFGREINCQTTKFWTAKWAAEKWGKLAKKFLLQWCIQNISHNVVYKVSLIL